MDAHQQQEALVHLFRNDGVMSHLINEASFVTSSELILSNLFSYISIKNLNLRFDISLNQESSYCHDNETWDEMEVKV